VENILRLIFGEFFLKASEYLQCYPQSFPLIHIKCFFSRYWHLL